MMDEWSILGRAWPTGKVLAWQQKMVSKLPHPFGSGTSENYPRWTSDFVLDNIKIHPSYVELL